MNFRFKDQLFSSSHNETRVLGVNSEQWSLIFKELYKSNENPFKKTLFILPTQEEAETFFESIKSVGDISLFPDFGCEIYSSMLPSEFNLVKRISIISKILKKPEFNTIVCSAVSLNILCPPQEFFNSGELTLNVSDIIPPKELAEKIINSGYQYAPSIEEPGFFTNKGEIFDIYPIDGHPFRITYFDDMIEEMYQVEPNTLKSIKDQPLDSVSIGKSQHSFLTKKNITEFRSQFPRPKLNESDKFSYREAILKKLSNNSFFEDYPLFTSYFFKEKCTLLNYAQDYQTFIFNKEDCVQNLKDLKENLLEEYDNFSKEADSIKPSPEMLYHYDLNLNKPHTCINDLNFNNHQSENALNIELNFTRVLQQKSEKTTKINQALELIRDSLNRDYKVRIYWHKLSSKAEITYLVDNFIADKISSITYHEEYLVEGFAYDTEKTLYLSENDFFSKKTKKVSSKFINHDKDLFAEQISTLQENDFVIHQDFGVGRYLGIETLDLSGSNSDYLVILYQDNDKVYVPVYKINLVQKHASNTATVSLSNLKTKKFDKAKSKAREAVKKLAFDLLELQAKRKLKKGYAFSEPDHLFKEFSLSFKFTETPDQARAISDVIDDMVSHKPMDRLVCGDVGFGKTEVAIRAAYKAVLDKKQVCILVPTTVLALQHYNSFCERFKETAVTIDFISRFKTSKQVNETLNKLRDGKIDILIGTHKVLSDKVDFLDLGLLVIDEEQRFGVGHKEKLKLLRENIDTLTLTATPIPRTLQMSFLGIKDLSVIKTPPSKRQSIKTYIIKEDLPTLKIAIDRELKRGGQVFIVHNKVMDIEIFTSRIRDIVPQARIIFAHGQLPERELEKRISDFYNYKYDILIATTIIESGIDIPRANTMIIDRADTYGLSQLHQLRGRIGRSDKKAYAYFMVPNNRNLSEVATKRLKALQTYADLGSGYSLATSDLEIRGSGDILGPEQSGHIGSIGLELYLELLKDCINEISGSEKVINKNIEIQTPFSAYIPNKYISDGGVRLKFYKKISNAISHEEVSHITDQLLDQFGKVPQEATTLITLIKSRINLSSLAINFVKVASTTITLKFEKSDIESNENLRNKVINLFTQRPKIYKINPDYSIICKFKDKIDIDTLLEFTGYLKDNLK